MRESDLWFRLDRTLGADYSRSWAADHVIAVLGGRTVVQALAAGFDAKRVWRAVCGEIEVARTLR